MNEATARIISLAAFIPTIVILLIYLVLAAQLARRLRSLHVAEWQTLGRPAPLWNGGAFSTVRLASWIGSRGYLKLEDPHTIALGVQCRLAYLGMIAVAIWDLGVVVYSSVAFH